MLKLRGQCITTNYKEHIQESVIKDGHLKWFLDKYDGSKGLIYKSETYCYIIYWKRIGQARKNINDYDNI